MINGGLFVCVQRAATNMLVKPVILSCIICICLAKTRHTHACCFACWQNCTRMDMHARTHPHTYMSHLKTSSFELYYIYMPCQDTSRTCMLLCLLAQLYTHGHACTYTSTYIHVTTSHTRTRTHTRTHSHTLTLTQAGLREGHEPYPSTNIHVAPSHTHVHVHTHVHTHIRSH